jgi:hypothetical protein
MTNEPTAHEPPPPPPPTDSTHPTHPTGAAAPPPPPPPTDPTHPTHPTGAAAPPPPSMGPPPSGQPPPGSASALPPSGPPPPGQPYPGAVPPPNGKDNTQLYGILGIVIAVICCAPLGILFGYLSMQEAKKHGKDETLGKVGFWLGIALTVLGLIAVVLGLCFGALGSWDVNRYRYDY